MPKIDLSTWGPATVLVVALVLIAAISGGVVVAFGHDASLNFEEYLNLLSKFVVGIGVLAVGRGILGAGKENAKAGNPSYQADLDDTDGAEDDGGLK